MEKDTKKTNENIASWIYQACYSIYGIIVGVIFSGICTWIFVKGANTATKTAIVPFVICGLAVLMISIIRLLKAINIVRQLKAKNISSDEIFKTHDNLNKADNIFSKIYVIGFSIFWFGFLMFVDYIFIRDGQFMFLAFSILFWIVGIEIIRKKLKR